ncbi:hypothetical protein ACFV7Q_27075 [Streptomyces sp. NPDC059851]|uniref:hypothetical protein n=1 Tax=Streptomyces sp. NPDC059851 TaxID=3346971 RepID=UPI00365DC71C
MRHRISVPLALGAALAIAPMATASAATATAPTTVTADQCFNNGGFYGGYNSDAKAFCTRGVYDGIPFDKDPRQGWCPDGQHIVFRYLQGLFCVPNVPNSKG